MNGHSVGRCFKVHGYQPGFKFKDSKIVAAVSVNCENGNEKEASHISQSQYWRCTTNIPQKLDQTLKLMTLAGNICLYTSIILNR